MTLKFHHINFSTKNVAEMAEFYKNILLLKDEECDIPKLDNKEVYSGEVCFVTDGKIQTHIAEMDLIANFKNGQAINPLARGHIAFRTDDLENFKEHLRNKKITFSDWGESAVSGWKQIFFHDPEGNIIEVHEKSKT